MPRCHDVINFTQYLPTAYVVRREGYVLTRVCPSVCPHPGGVYPSQVQAGGGLPPPGPAGGYPCWGLPLPRGTPPQVPPVGPGQGVSTLGTPITPGQGVPHQGYPCWGVPTLGTPIRPGQGYPCQGVPHLRYPPIRPGWGYPTSGTPPLDQARGTPENGVLHLGYPPWSDLAGGYPCQGGTPPQIINGVLDTPRSVCLLRSRRRTFLFLSNFIVQRLISMIAEDFTETIAAL